MGACEVVHFGKDCQAGMRESFVGLFQGAEGSGRPGMRIKTEVGTQVQHAIGEVHGNC